MRGGGTGAGGGGHFLGEKTTCWFVSWYYVVSLIKEPECEDYEGTFTRIRELTRSL